MKKLIPIKENQEKGFHSTVTDEQIAAHQKLTLHELFEWLESTNRFVSKLQTPEEKQRSIRAKNIG
ncbi:MAG TPA: hypothetical protein VGO45_01105 [Bacteroidia bacterium]|jgi:DNA-directed RNA polymerase specialized sigma subunit|nr:hypothetical protein [Bacteroidia bacterium]